MSIPIVRSFFFTLIMIIMGTIPTVATASDSETDDPYTLYENVFTEMVSYPSNLVLSPILSQMQAYGIFNAADEKLQADYEYFCLFEDLPLIDPYFIPYLFAKQYEDDPRYGLDFLIEKAEQRITEQCSRSIMEPAVDEIEWEKAEPATIAMLNPIFSFPHLVLGYRGKEAVPYLINQWLTRFGDEDESSLYYEFALRASGAEALSQIKHALSIEVLNDKQPFSLVYLLDEMAGPAIYRVIPGTPYVLDEAGIRDVNQFLFDYFFEHPYDLGGRSAASFLAYSDSGFQPDTDRLIAFLKTDEDRGALSKAIILLREHVTKDDERLVDLIPTVKNWFADEEKIDVGISFVGMVTDNFTFQLEEPYASVFYPPIYKAFMTTQDDGTAWETFCTIYGVFRDRSLSEWGLEETERLVSFMSDFGDLPDYIYTLNELGRKTGMDFGPLVGDIIRFIPQPPEDQEDDFESVEYYIDILLSISLDNPGIIAENLEEMYSKLQPWVGLVNISGYSDIISNLKKANITIPPDLIELK